MDETVLHIIWRALEKWLKRKHILDTADKLTDCNIIFGDYNGNRKTGINLMILIMKQYIYAAKYARQKPTFIGALTKAVTFQKIEYRIAPKQKQMIKQKRKWNFIVE